MKKLKLLISTVMCFTLLSLISVDVAATNVPVAPCSQDGVDVIVYADYIDWRIAFFDGVLYKRLYNYSLEQWVGEWIYVG
ncbi:MAG: hypothetical protein LBS21_05095 [Clostridiales bacterium]|jgi:hypothetical protein|nr:hypothetical protein [Clostridiales bacterium]